MAHTGWKAGSRIFQGVIGGLAFLLFAGSAQAERLTAEQAGLGAAPYRIGGITVALHPAAEVQALCGAPWAVAGCYRPETHTVVAQPEPAAVLAAFQEYFRAGAAGAKLAAEEFVRFRLGREATVVEVAQSSEGWEVTVVAVEFNQKLQMITDRALYRLRLDAETRVVSATAVPAGMRAQRDRRPRVALRTDSAGAQAGQAQGSGVHQVGPVTAVLRPQREVAAICGGAGLAQREGERVLGCYLPASHTLVAVPDPLVVLHELKHYLEGNFHQMDDHTKTAR